jgi:hypothetical protein
VAELGLGKPAFETARHTSKRVHTDPDVLAQPPPTTTAWDKVTLSRQLIAAMDQDRKYVQPQTEPSE